MERNNKNIGLRDPDGNSERALAPLTLLKHSGKAAGIGALTGAIAGAVAGAVAGAAAWSMWVLGREAIKAVRERTRL